MVSGHCCERLSFGQGILQSFCKPIQSGQANTLIIRIPARNPMNSAFGPGFILFIRRSSLRFGSSLLSQKSVNEVVGFFV
jgi:hypothetical protein